MPYGRLPSLPHVTTSGVLDLLHWRSAGSPPARAGALALSRERATPRDVFAADALVRVVLGGRGGAVDDGAWPADAAFPAGARRAGEERLLARAGASRRELSPLPLDAQFAAGSSPALRAFLCGATAAFEGAFAAGAPFVHRPTTPVDDALLHPALLRGWRAAAAAGAGAGAGAGVEVSVLRARVVDVFTLWDGSGLGGGGGGDESSGDDGAVVADEAGKSVALRSAAWTQSQPLRSLATYGHYFGLLPPRRVVARLTVAFECSERAAPRPAPAAAAGAGASAGAGGGAAAAAWAPTVHTATFEGEAAFEGDALLPAGTPAALRAALGVLRLFFPLAYVAPRGGFRIVDVDGHWAPAGASVVPGDAPTQPPPATTAAAVAADAAASGAAARAGPTPAGAGQAAAAAAAAADCYATFCEWLEWGARLGAESAEHAEAGLVSVLTAEDSILRERSVRTLVLAARGEADAVSRLRAALARTRAGADVLAMVARPERYDGSGGDGDGGGAAGAAGASSTLAAAVSVPTAPRHGRAAPPAAAAEAHAATLAALSGEPPGASGASTSVDAWLALLAGGLRQSADAAHALHRWAAARGGGGLAAPWAARAAAAVAIDAALNRLPEPADRVALLHGAAAAAGLLPPPTTGAVAAALAAVAPVAPTAAPSTTAAASTPVAAAAGAGAAGGDGGRAPTAGARAGAPPAGGAPPPAPPPPPSAEQWAAAVAALDPASTLRHLLELQHAAPLALRMYYALRARLNASSGTAVGELVDARLKAYLASTGALEAVASIAETLGRAAARGAGAGAGAEAGADAGAEAEAKGRPPRRGGDASEPSEPASASAAPHAAAERARPAREEQLERLAVVARATGARVMEGVLRSMWADSVGAQGEDEAAEGGDDDAARAAGGDAGDAGGAAAAAAAGAGAEAGVSAGAAAATAATAAAAAAATAAEEAFEAALANAEALADGALPTASARGGAPAVRRELTARVAAVHDAALRGLAAMEAAGELR